MENQLWEKLGIQDPKLIEELEKAGEYKIFKKNETILYLDKEINEINILVDGIVKCYHLSKEGNEIVHTITDEIGAIIAPIDFSLINYPKSSEESTALIESKVFSIQITSLLQIKEKYPIIDQITENIRSTYSIHFLYILNLFREFNGYDLYIKFVQEHLNIVRNVTQNDLAAFLGLNVRNISHYKSKLKKDYPELYNLLKNNNRK